MGILVMPWTRFAVEYYRAYHKKKKITIELTMPNHTKRGSQMLEAGTLDKYLRGGKCPLRQEVCVIEYRKNSLSMNRPGLGLFQVSGTEDII